jgi:hypothetical protein
MLTDDYKAKTGKQFLGSIKMADQKYDDDIIQIFQILDKMLIH